MTSAADLADIDRLFSACSGLLVAYCHRFDLLTQSSRIYFVACTVGTYEGL